MSGNLPLSKQSYRLSVIHPCNDLNLLNQNSLIQSGQRAFHFCIVWIQFFTFLTPIFTFYFCIRLSHLISPSSPSLLPLTSPHLTSPQLSSAHLTSPHLTSPHLTSPHLTSTHLTSPSLPHLTSLHLTSPSLPHLISPHLTFLSHLTAPHYTSPHPTSCSSSTYEILLQNLVAFPSCGTLCINLFTLSIAHFYVLYFLFFHCHFLHLLLYFTSLHFSQPVFFDKFKLLRPAEHTRKCV